MATASTTTWWWKRAGYAAARRPHPNRIEADMAIRRYLPMRTFPGRHRVVVGTGASGQLPIMPEVWEEARVRGVELTAVPTAEACRLLEPVDRSDVYAILHVTC